MEKKRPMVTFVIMKMNYILTEAPRVASEVVLVPPVQGGEDDGLVVVAHHDADVEVGGVAVAHPERQAVEPLSKKPMRNVEKTF